MTQLKQRDVLMLSIVTAGIVLPFYISSVIMALALGRFIWCNRQQWTEQLFSMKYLIGFIIMTGVNSLFNRNYPGAFVAVALFLVALFFRYYTYIVTPQLYRSLLRILSLSSFVALGKAVWDYAHFVITQKFSWLYIVHEASPQFRAESTLFNANYFGLYCIFIILINIYLWSVESRWRWILIYAMSIGLSGVGIVLTASRMVYPALFVAVVWLVFFLNRHFGKIVAFGAIAIAVLLILNPSLLPRLSSIRLGLDDRLEIWQAGWNIFAMSPLLGRGPLSYAKYYYLFDSRATMHSHQVLIDTLANYGLFGVLILVAIATPFLRQLLQKYHDKTVRREFGLVTSMLVAVAVHGLMDVSVFWVQTGYIFLLVILAPLLKFKEMVEKMNE